MEKKVIFFGRYCCCPNCKHCTFLDCDRNVTKENCQNTTSSICLSGHDTCYCRCFDAFYSSENKFTLDAQGRFDFPIGNVPHACPQDKYYLEICINNNSLKPMSVLIDGLPIDGLICIPGGQGCSADVCTGPISNLFIEGTPGSTGIYSFAVYCA
ncbi:MAG: hypothetical protein RLZ12_141 [Bacillota bacterium]|jgi:hypothetical protein